jgi:uncharacterized membrane protein
VGFENVVDIQLADLKTSGRWGYGIDNDGTTLVGQILIGPGYVPFARVGTAESELDLSPLAPPGSGSRANDVSADGTTIVGGSTDSVSGTLEAFSCQGSTCEYVADWVAGETTHSAEAVNGDGSVVAGHSAGGDGLGLRAWRWTRSNDATTALELAAGTWAHPAVYGISRDGTAIAGSVTINGVGHAILWTGSEGTAQDLGTGVAFDTSSDGSITVGSDNSGNAVIWNGTTKQLLANLLGDNPDLEGAALYVARAVSDDGKVVAGTASIDGDSRAFMARLP